MQSMHAACRAAVLGDDGAASAALTRGSRCTTLGPWLRQSPERGSKLVPRLHDLASLPLCYPRKAASALLGSPASHCQAVTKARTTAQPGWSSMQGIASRHKLGPCRRSNSRVQRHSRADHAPAQPRFKGLRDACCLLGARGLCSTPTTDVSRPSCRERGILPQFF